MATYNISNSGGIGELLAAFFSHGEPEVVSQTITDVSTDFQIVVAPHPAPATGYYRSLYYVFDNPDVAAAIITIWDEDLTVGTTATARGATATPLQRFTVPPASVMCVVPTPEMFQAGICVQSDKDNVHMSALLVKFVG